MDSRSRLLILTLCGLAFLALLPHVAGEALLAKGMTLATLPVRPHAPRLTREHAMIVSVLEPGREQVCPEPRPAIQLIARVTPALQGHRVSAPLEDAVARLALVDQHLSTGQRLLARLALSRAITESWSTAEQAEYLSQTWSFGPCGVGLDAAARDCFGVPASALDEGRLAALIRDRGRPSKARVQLRGLQEIYRSASSRVCAPIDD